MTANRHSDTPAIILDRVTKRFDSVVAVDDLSLEIKEGEFFSLLGPSGCGKTTTLRMLGGFETPDEGTVYLRGEDVTLVRPNKRATNLVFQNYELFPHMTIAENVAYGLKLKKVAKPEIAERVSEMMRVVGISGLDDRVAGQLSGGQQQRVALARALINRPAVLLLDEPLSALDVKLRKRMQLELKSIQATLRTTFVYVTHDQEEALLMSDRIGIMNEGKLLQVATPRTIYDHPNGDFVADFIGTLNDFVVSVDRVDEGLAVSLPGAEQRITVMVADGRHPGDVMRIAVRPERIEVVPREDWDEPAESNRVHATVADVIYMGPFTQYVIESEVLGRVVSQSVSNDAAFHVKSGMRVVLTWPIDAAFALSAPADIEDDEGTTS